MAYVSKLLLFGAITFYVFAAFTAVKKMLNLIETEHFEKDMFRNVIFGMTFMVVLTGVNLFENSIANRQLWQPMMAVNFVSLFLNAATLHTIYWKWEVKWPIWLAFSIIFVDANLRFIVLYFLT